MLRQREGQTKESTGQKASRAGGGGSENECKSFDLGGNTAKGTMSALPNTFRACACKRGSSGGISRAGAARGPLSVIAPLSDPTIPCPAGGTVALSSSPTFGSVRDRRLGRGGCPRRIGADQTAEMVKCSRERSNTAESAPTRPSRSIGLLKWRPAAAQSPALPEARGRSLSGVVYEERGEDEGEHQADAEHARHQPHPLPPYQPALVPVPAVPPVSPPPGPLRGRD